MTLMSREITFSERYLTKPNSKRKKFDSFEIKIRQKTNQNKLYKERERERERRCELKKECKEVREFEEREEVLLFL
jgi:hypothetical protein